MTGASTPLFRQLPSPADYATTIDAMAAHAAAIRTGTAGEEIWLLEHHPVLTGGTSANEADLINPGNTPVHTTGRGGQWTWHGPGQRVAYVMLDLAARTPDIRAYVASLEGWIIDVLDRFGVHGQRREGHPGIWVDAGERMDKVAAIGVRISRWVSWHGVAINLDPDLSAFDAIVPCGVTDGGVTSLRQLGVDVDMAMLDAALRDSFATHFPDPAP
jgi:lipoyl(octanoyl) transferase